MGGWGGNENSLTLGEKERPIRQMGRGDQGERVGQGVSQIAGYQDITPDRQTIL